MNIKYIKNIFFLILISIFLFSCDGKDCVEADDFGEYDTDILTIDSKYNLCQWDNDNEKSRSSTILQCLNDYNGNVILDQNCSVKLNGKSCFALKDCLDGVSDECYNNFAIIGSGECEKLDKKTSLQKAYENCLQSCMDSCLSTSFMNEDSFETNWESNLFKEDKGSIGINLVPSQLVDVQVLGSINLNKQLENDIIFNNLSSNKVQYKDKYYSENLEPVLSGGWCNKKVDGVCANWIGEKNGEGEVIQKRYEFLRRGVLVLNNLPNGGVLDENGNYKGPDIFINYDNWKCNYNTTDNFVDCKTDYPDFSYKNQNDANFAMENNFIKNRGGLVVPISMNKFILSAPDVTNNNSIETSIDLPGSLSKNTYLFKNDLSIKSLYPVKLAFAINGNSENETCDINITQENFITSYNVSIKTNGKWFFPLKDNKQAVFNKTQYNTLKEYSGTDGIDTSKTNYFNIRVTSQNCNDKEILVFAMPQNEILMKKSGFVSFKNLLGDFSDYNINFDIINPLYDYQSNNELLNKNFYEYVDINEKPESKTLTIKKNKWTDEVFVRNGQILRFDSNSWFDISGNNDTGYTITRKTANVDGNTISVGDSLALKIEYRPAVLCKGEAEEKVDNSDCTKIYNSKTENYECAKKTYAEVCSDENTEYYCPLGCYYDEFNVAKYLDGVDTNQYCPVIDNVNPLTCDKCAKKLDEVNKNIGTSIKVDLIQCYDLENYKGAVRNLLDLSGTTLYSTNVSEYGELTNNDKILKAKKLDNIFYGGNYGNLDTMSVDTSFMDLSTQKFSEFKYNSPSSISSKDKLLSFFVIDNSNFDSDFKNNYNDNYGEYSFAFTPKQNFNNGQQLAVALATKNWNGKTDGENDCLDDKQGCFKSWIVQYNIDKNNENTYGQINSNSPYIFDSNGYIVGNNQSTSGDSKIHLDHLSIDLPEDQYEDLRLFFKIIDKPELEQCNNGSSTKVIYTNTLCKCRTGNNSSTYGSCNEISCDQLCKCKSGSNSTNYTKCTDEECSNIKCDDNIQLECDSNVVTKEENYCVNSYYNNTGSYTIKMKTPRDVINSTGYIVKYVIKPILEVLDGKVVALQINNNKQLMACDSTDSSRCNYYFPQSKFDEYEIRFGEKCSAENNNTEEGIICYKNCSDLDTTLYKTNCKHFNNGGGFLQRFYVSVITDRDYQIIVRLCFTLMIMFYGMYYLMGMAELTYAELINKAVKIGFIYLMIGTKGWEYYNMFFVKFFKQGMDYLVFAVAGAFDNSPDLANAFTRGDFYDKSVLFSGVDKNLSLLFSDTVSYKIWGLFFVSFFGWLYVFIIYASIFTYIFSVANAMLLYLTAQFFLSILLAMGPIFLVMLIFQKTKEMFNKWISNLIAFGLEQIVLLTCVSLFNILIYNVIKFVLSYRVCWKPIWEINIPVLGSLQLMSFWKATTATSASAAATAVPGLFQILLIYLVADLMGKFIEFSTDLGGSLGGSGMYLKDLASDIKKTGQDFYNKRIKQPMKTATKALAERTGKKLIGYRTAKEEAEEDEGSKTARHALRKATREADRAVSKYKRDNYEKLNSMTEQERMDKIADVRKQAFIDNFKKAGGEDAMKKLDLTYKNKDGEEKQILTAEEVFDNRVIDKDLMASHSILGFGVQKTGLRSAVSIHNIGGTAKSGISIGGGHQFRTGAFTSAKRVDEKIRTGEVNDPKYNFVDRFKVAHKFGKNKKDRDDIKDSIKSMNEKNKIHAQENKKNIKEQKQELKDFEKWKKTKKEELKKDIKKENFDKLNNQFNKEDNKEMKSLIEHYQNEGDEMNFLRKRHMKNLLYREGKKEIDKLTLNDYKKEIDGNNKKNTQSNSGNSNNNPPNGGDGGNGGNGADGADGGDGNNPINNNENNQDNKNNGNNKDNGNNGNNEDNGNNGNNEDNENKDNKNNDNNNDDSDDSDDKK